MQVESSLRPPLAALVQDLFFSSRIADAARHLGLAAYIEPQADAFEEKVREHRPGVALIDLGLRGVDWASAVRRLRADPGFATLPIVAFGPHMDLEARERALAAGCTEFLSNSKLTSDLAHIVARYTSPR
jgi:CheY-like chemotaxis protein